MRRVVSTAVALSVAVVGAASANARVLRVGTYKGVRGQFKSIQAAVDAARPGDWVLVGPGDYKEHSGRTPRGKVYRDRPAGVLITTPRLRLRGMNRNTVIVDGTKPGAAKCSNKPSAQEYGPKSRGKALGLNGIMVWRANNVWIQNLTACNYLSGAGDTGNEIWWNGGHGSERGGIGGRGFLGSYLNATTTFFRTDKTAAQYGIFSSNWNGGTWDQTYASNFSDSGYYIGACLQQCNQTINAAWAEFNSLGYSGSNSGGVVVIKNSQWDNNTDGFDTNSQNGDNPPPQNGACPNNGISPITHTHSCWVLMNNYIHDNNNPNVPGVGAAGSVPVGVGLSLSGARNDTIMNNRIVRNNAWGVLIQIFPDSGPPCTGGVRHVKVLGLLPVNCLFDPWGNAIVANSFARNGSYGHTTNGDIAVLNALDGKPTNCYQDNTDPSGLTTSPADLETTFPSCNGAGVPAVANTALAVELLCGAEGSLVGANIKCPGGKPYPKRTRVVMHALPTRQLKTMSNPCAGVPRNPWCPGRRR